MEKKKINILLDQDGVITDFASAALVVLNRHFGKSITIDDYAEFGGWEMWVPYNSTAGEFWRLINSNTDVYLDAKPFPWYKELYDKLSAIGEVTILTAPSRDAYESVSNKLYWLNKYLNLNTNDVVIGSKKHLLAGNGILIDDNIDNVSNFIAAGGKAILVPSNWNTKNLTFEDVWKVIEQGFLSLGLDLNMTKEN